MFTLLFSTAVYLTDAVAAFIIFFIHIWSKTAVVCIIDPISSVYAPVLTPNKKNYMKKIVFICVESNKNKYRVHQEMFCFYFLRESEEEKKKSFSSNRCE